MLEFKKYLLHQEQNAMPMPKLKDLYKTIFKKGSCGGKSCSRGTDGGWHDNEFELNRNINPNTISSNISPLRSPDKNIKIYLDDEKSIIILEKLFEKIIVDNQDLQQINNFIQKNKDFILNQINRQTDELKYKNYRLVNKKLTVYYVIQSIVAKD